MTSRRTRSTSRTSRALTALVWMAFAAFFVSTASAASINVKPVQIHLSEGAKTGNIKVTNTSGQSVAMQLNAVQWSQDIQGHDLESETNDVIFFPQLFTLAPGESKAVRVGLKSSKATAHERTYRLYLQQLPVDLEQRAGVLNVLLRIGVPIFFAPSKRQSDARLADLTFEGCKATVRLENRGTSHFRPEHVSIDALDSDGESLFVGRHSGWYVLVGASRLYTFELPKEACERVERFRVDVQKRDGSLQRTFDDN